MFKYNKFLSFIANNLHLSYSSVAGGACFDVCFYSTHYFNAFYLKNLRGILGVSWRDRESNAEVLRQCGCNSMHTILNTRRLRWFGHVRRLTDDRLPQVAILVKGVERACAERNGGGGGGENLCAMALRKQSLDGGR